MSIRYKLTITFFVFGLLLTLTMGALMKWSFKRDFGHYVQQKHLEQLHSAAPALEEFYAQTQSWQPIAQRPRRLYRLLAPALNQPADHHHRPSRSEKHFMASVYLLDSNKNPIVGRYQPEKVLQEIELRSGSAIVGYLGTLKHNKRLNPSERVFEERQGKSLFYVIVLSLLFSLVFSWPLSKALIRRVELLAGHIRQLSNGQYEKRVSIGGHDELTGLTDHLNHLGQTLQHSEEARRKLVADVSHELRTPLATLKAQLEAIEDGVHQYNDATHKRLQDQVQRLNQLVDDLYTLSLADIGALQYQKSHYDLKQIIDDTYQTFKAAFEKANLNLALINNLPETSPVFADEKRLQQLFSNLLQNSLQYTDAPGATLIESEQVNNQYIIRIHDSAPDVPTQQRAHLLERLYRADSSRNRQSGGAGLGLSLCQTIAQAHNGSIEIDESKLGGLCVSVHLPCPDKKV